MDGLPYQTARFPLNKPEDWYVLCQGLTYGKHTVKVVKQTEIGKARAAVTAVKILGDGEINPTENKSFKLEFIGDSITWGYGNICSDSKSDFLTGEENFSLTYADIASEIFEADVSCIAASGNGVFHDYGCNTHNLIPELYHYTDKMLSEHYGKEPELWDFNSDKKNLIFIKLGQNDGQYCSGADLAEVSPEELCRRREAFSDKVYMFLKQVNEVRPETPIIYIYERDMLLKTEICEAINRFNFQNNIVTGFEIEPKREYESCGANGHWSVYTNARVALQLCEKVREILYLQ